MLKCMMLILINLMFRFFIVKIWFVYCMFLFKIRNKKNKIQKQKRSGQQKQKANKQK